MARHKSSKPGLLPDDGPIPEGFTRHQGGAMPVEPLSTPAVFMRGGTKMLPGHFPAKHWDVFAEGSCWAWQGRAANAFDILGYRIES